MTHISAVTLTKQLVRFGYLSMNASGTALNPARLGGSFEIEQCGG